MWVRGCSGDCGSIIESWGVFVGGEGVDEMVDGFRDGFGCAGLSW